MQSKRQKKLAYYVFLQKHDYQQKNENYICEITKFGGIFIVNSFKLITITHKTANINHIGKYIPSVNSNPEKLAATLHHIKKVLRIDEILYLATCNRLMFFVHTNENMDRVMLLRFFELLHAESNVPIHCLGGLLEVVKVYEGEKSVQHLFEVTSSLDSLVVGEREIIRQIKDAYEFCRLQKLTGDNIRLVLEKAIPLAKYIYTHTKIGENSVSIVSLSMQKLLKLNPSKESRILIIGAGQTNNLVAKFLTKHSFKNFVIFNRSIENAKLFANKLKGNGYRLSELADYTGGFDIMITCTGASHPLITETLYEQLLNGEAAPKIIIDLAVPNDVERGVVNHFPVYYIEVERLRCLAAENLKLRQQEVSRALAIIEEHLDEFKVTLRTRRIERAMAVIPEEVKQVKERALNGVFQKEIAELDQNAQDTLERVLAYMEKKYIGIPMRVARNVLETELFTN